MLSLVFHSSNFFGPPSSLPARSIHKTHFSFSSLTLPSLAVWIFVVISLSSILALARSLALASCFSFFFCCFRLCFSSFFFFSLSSLETSFLIFMFAKASLAFTSFFHLSTIISCASFVSSRFAASLMASSSSTFSNRKGGNAFSSNIPKNGLTLDTFTREDHSVPSALASLRFAPPFNISVIFRGPTNLVSSFFAMPSVCFVDTTMTKSPTAKLGNLTLLSYLTFIFP